MSYTVKYEKPEKERACKICFDAGRTKKIKVDVSNNKKS